MINGILIVNKESGCTSRDVVNNVSRILKTKKIGHTGTLDPIASGVLVLTIGNCTKLSELLTSKEKRYIATCILGIKTDTLDTEGNILEEMDTNFNEKEINNALNHFKTTYNQQVPLYSAVKINGKKLYEYARNNEEVELPSKDVTIKEIKLLDLKHENNKTIVKFECLVSKGTYIRSLINDIAAYLNTYGIMTDLIRTKQGNYDINDSITIDKINSDLIIPLDEVLKDHYTVIVDDKLLFKVKNGAFIDNIYNEEYVVFKNDNILALYKDDNGILKPFKMFL